MSDIEKAIEKMDKREREPDTQETVNDPASGPQDEPQRLAPGLRDRVRKFLDAGHTKPGTKTDQKKDRTRSMALLIGGVVGAMLLFVGVFSTPPIPTTREPGGRAAPNLGRPAPANQSAAVQGSATPLLNADIQSQDSFADQLSPADIRGTSSRSFEGDEHGGSQETSNVKPGSPRLPVRQSIGSESVNSFSANAADPLAAYRSNNVTGAPAYSYGGAPVSRAGSEPSKAFSYGSDISTSNDTRRSGAGSVESSIVFVRSPGSVDIAATARSTPGTALNSVALLPSGTRLAARLESAATTAVKTPVVASIEYNYERDGRIIVPAGTKVIGDVQQASTEGYLSIRFHTLQLPNGRDEMIEATAVALDHKPLKGSVSGKNTAKKVLSRTLSGAGTVAAYVVGGGGGGAGLGRTITGETLLRDRIAGNIALAGEQELMNAAYSQNISVTVPANTRFYVILQKSARNSMTPAPSRIAESAPQRAEIPTVQELRELMDLRREINRMYQESNAVPGGVNPFR